MPLSPETQFRFRIVSAVDLWIAQGYGVGEAVRQVAALAHRDGPRARTVAVRTIERWRHDFQQHGIDGLERTVRAPLEGSRVLSPALLEFLRQEHELDEAASIPELIERARLLGHVAPDAEIDRTTVYRALTRMGLCFDRQKRADPGDKRRFEIPERMQLVTADFTHFRAGTRRLRRLALYVMDKSTRAILDVSVTTGGERSSFVLQALARVMMSYGRFDRLYVDHGPGFVADDLEAVMATNFGIPVVLGRVRYPEGRGGHERQNGFAKARHLTALDRSDVDTTCGQLTLRLQHDAQRYNDRVHGSLQGQTPWQRWSAGRPLVPVDEQTLSQKFLVSFERTVSRDHVVSVDGVALEMPLGFARKRVMLYRQVLEDDQPVFVEHRGKLVRLHPVDAVENGRSKRAKGTVASTKEAVAADAKPPRPTASMIAFERDLGRVTDADGGFSEHPSDPEPES